MLGYSAWVQFIPRVLDGAEVTPNWENYFFMLLALCTGALPHEAFPKLLLQNAKKPTIV